MLGLTTAGYNGWSVKRRLFTILSALSLLLFVAVCVLWVRSYLVSDRVSDYSWIGSSKIRTEVQSGLGAVGVQVCVHSLTPEKADEIKARWQGNPLAGTPRHRKPWPQRPDFGVIEGGTYVTTGPFQIAWFGYGTVFGPGMRLVLPYWVLATGACLLMVPWGWARKVISGP